MIIKNIVDEDFTNYKVCSMFVGFPSCTFKCEKECGLKMCQNSALVHSPNITVAEDQIVNRYLSNDLSRAVVCGGLEPFDSFDELHTFIKLLRKKTTDDVVIYTGYNRNEINTQVDMLKKYPNIIIKFGRYIPNEKSHYDEILGISLASNNQYAEKIS